MLIVLLDDPELDVFPSAEDAARAIEAVDAENAFSAAFNELAVPYRVEWVRPFRLRKVLFGLIGLYDGGEYRFVPAGPANPAALVELLEVHSHPSEYESELRALLTRLRAA